MSDTETAEQSHAVGRVEDGTARSVPGRHEADRPVRRWRPSRATLTAVLITLLVTGVISWTCFTVNSRNEDRLLHLQAEQTGSLLQAVLPTIQTPLASAAEIAATSGGDTGDFDTYMSGYVAPKGPFVSASLWRVSGATAQQVTSVGKPPELDGQSARADRFLTGVARSGQLDSIGPLGSSDLRLGWAYSSTGSRPGYVVYAESALPPNRRAATPSSNSPFSDLVFALYLGKSARPAALLESNAIPPLTGRTATVVVPFGANSLTLVASSRTHLGGDLSAWLWWIVAILGVLLAAVVGLTAERLVRRRRAAERLTGEVQQLLGEQRGIAEALQRALLPHVLPELRGLQFAVRYLPGVNGVEIGGDWYDVIAVDERCCVFVIGDVSGRGVNAGAVMASLNFAIRGFVSEGYDPETILDKVQPLLSLVRDQHFATVLCGMVDVDRHEVRLANAGHLPPLVVSANGTDFVNTPVGSPIGVPYGGGYQQVTISLPPEGTLLAYTDGLVERRDEDLDVGLERLRVTAAAATGSVDDVVDTVLAGLRNGGFDDDTAILAMRWLS